MPPRLAYAIIAGETASALASLTLSPQKMGIHYSGIPLEARYPMHVVTLYAKAGCHLCDEARAYLEEALAEVHQELDLREADIRTDPELFERYRYRIPVIVVDGVERLEGRVSDDAVRELLRSLP